MAPAVLSLDNVTLGYSGFVAVDSLCLEVFAGEVFGLLGPNGSGKSTTLSAIAGTLAPLAGEIRVRGLGKSSDSLSYRRQIGLVPQELALFDDFTADQHLLFFGQLYGLSGVRLHDRVAEVLDFVRLTEQAGRRVRTFSGGMRRKLNLGCALLHEPALLLLDEPTVGLDVQSREAIFDVLRVLRDAGCAHRLHHAPPRRSRAALRPHRHHGSWATACPGHVVGVVRRPPRRAGYGGPDKPRARVPGADGKEPAGVMIQPRLVWELARKDLQLFVADRKGVLLCFGVPILLASAFGAIFHRPDDCRVDLPVQVVAQDDGPLTQSVVKALCSCERLQASPCDLDTAQRLLAAESGIFIVLPRDFSQLGKGVNLPRVKILHHPRNQVESKLVEGILTEIVFRESARQWLGPLAKIRPELLRDRPFVVECLSEPASGALSTNAFSHSFCGMTLQYLLFWGMDSGLLLLRERKQGIWQRLRAAPLTETTLLSGKALATALIALAQIASTFSFGALVFGVTVNGSVVGFVLMVFAAALLSAATGLLVAAALGGNETRARSVAILVILTLSLLGGLWLPSFLLPAWVQKLALALPTTWAARGLEGVTWQGMGLSAAWPCAVALLGFSVTFLVVAWWRLPRGESG